MILFKASVLAAAATATTPMVLPKSLRVDSYSQASIRDVAKTLAVGTMSYYPGNASTFADLPKPYYWWECGSLFNAMLDYSYYTGDTSYDETIATAIMAQVGPNYDFLVPSRAIQEGNDDQAFWGFAVLTAAERNFTQPAALTPQGMPSWLDLAINIWNNMVGRWDTHTCNGGFFWQIYSDNPNGKHYKNTCSNGGFFQLSARLARLTGNQTYIDWASKVWDWTLDMGLIDSNYTVFDGTETGTNCTEINPLSFSYLNGIYLYGAAVMANHTGMATWRRHAEGLLDAASQFFTPPYENATSTPTNILWEHACEQVGTCNTDMKSFKGILSRFLYATAATLPHLAPSIDSYMRPSAAAAAVACSGDNIDGVPTGAGATCGQKWYMDGFDGSVGLGQEMSALEAVQGLLLLDSVEGIYQPPATSSSPPTEAVPAPTASVKSGALDTLNSFHLRRRLLVLICSLFFWAMI